MKAAAFWLKVAEEKIFSLPLHEPPHEGLNPPGQSYVQTLSPKPMNAQTPHAEPWLTSTMRGSQTADRSDLDI